MRGHFVTERRLAALLEVARPPRMRAGPEGDTKKLWVKLTLTAPATATLDAFRFTKLWRVR